MTAQLALPLAHGRVPLGTRYLKWRAANPEIVREVIRRAVARANNGARRIEVNDLVADVRKDWKVRIDNSFRSRISDDAVAQYPFLDGLIERRQRKA